MPRHVGMESIDRRKLWPPHVWAGPANTGEGHQRPGGRNLLASKEVIQSSARRKQGEEGKKRDK